MLALLSQPRSYFAARRVAPLITIGALLAAFPAVGRAQDTGHESELLSRTRRLTFEGRRAGEGYFSRDGQQMVFQSEREPGNPFYQIYLLDLETGDIERVSPGYGKTTCAWMHPDGGRVLFASTHEDREARAKQKAELDLRASGKQRRYAWDYDEHFDLYFKDLRSGKLERLTSERGYDAEGSISSDGKLIVFSSNRHAFAETLSEQDAEKFAQDQSLFVDIYIMTIDGANVRRLTTARGYDGGPFFSPDGTRICWRRFSEDGATAEVYTMNLDGSDKRKLTSLGAMSWAPFYHPSGEYLLFTTNLLGFSNFELYLVSADGGEPVRVTNTEGFDGLPAFSPDGSQLAWTSTRASGDQGQLFLADWNHERARALLGPAVGAADAATQVENPVRPITRTVKTEPAIRAADLRAHIETLASEAFEGRLAGTEGERLATQYVADVFKQYGLEPAGDDGSYFQTFDFTAGVATGPENRLALQADGKPARSFTVDEDWRPLAYSKAGVIESSGIVFAGYGIVAPAEGEFDEYDSFVHLDVSGKWVMVFRYMPEDITPEHRQHLAHFSGLRYKAMVLRDKGARGMIVVSGPRSKVKHQLVKMRFDASIAGGSLSAISITDTVADAILAKSGRSLEERQAALDSGDPQMGFLVEGAELAATIDIERVKRTGRNVLARLRGDKTAGRAAVVIGAHVDHLGRGIGSNSLARDDEKNEIHYGADDNASGTAGVLEIAELLSDQVRRGKLSLQRDIVFAAWSGEELGLLGSNHFVNQIAERIGNAESIRSEIAACLNMDMIGRLTDSLIANGVASSSIWPTEIERRNVPVGLTIEAKKDSYLPTDATAFYLKGVPILSVFTGSHEDYHTPRDTADRINYEGARDVTRFMSLVARSLATRAEAPDYQKSEPPKQEARAGLRAYLGTIPDYGEAPIPGLQLSGVAEGGPAHAAGVRGGDVIVELAGRKIENIYDYTYAIEAVKIGQETTIAVIRDKERLTFKIVPGSRE